MKLVHDVKLGNTGSVKENENVIHKTLNDSKN